MKKLAIIPARGGSKRIFKKNIKDFLGQPIISYSIKSVMDSGLFDEVMVSTDDLEIANIAKKLGAKVPFLRSDINADDYASTIDVICEVIEEYRKIGKEFQYTCCVYPCAPFVSKERLEESFEKLLERGYDCVFPVTNFNFPIQRAVKLTAENKIEMLQPEFMQTRSQDLEPIYHDVGQFYFFETDKLIAAERLWTGNTGCIILPEMEAQDIDTLNDWQLAEIKYKILNSL
jgi:N-acylneuraminate cytidylyltransferase